MATKARWRTFLNPRTLTYWPLHFGCAVLLSYWLSGKLMGSVAYGLFEPTFQSLFIHALVINHWTQQDGRPSKISIENKISVTYLVAHVLGAMLLAFMFSGFNPRAAIAIGVLEPAVQLVVQRGHAVVFNKWSQR